MYLSMPGKHAGSIRLNGIDHRNLLVYCQADKLLDQTDDLTLIRKPVQFLLGKNLFLIDTDDKYTSGTRD